MPQFDVSAFLTQQSYDKIVGRDFNKCQDSCCYAVRMRTHHVLYVPGLGDAAPHGQELLPRYWQLFGVRGHYVPMQWHSGAFAPKLQRLIAKSCPHFNKILDASPFPVVPVFPVLL